ncbi:hypothetical protein M5689_013744 [Euphorbia peplus]|nr:hypothetical protein M5689_013742 [Euphorbia peplus]WCJ32310.1 hypothetical protein M5689_013744 [Euphorbia peplus]
MAFVDSSSRFMVIRMAPLPLPTYNTKPLLKISARDRPKSSPGGGANINSISRSAAATLLLRRGSKLIRKQIITSPPPTTSFDSVNQNNKTQSLLPDDDINNDDPTLLNIHPTHQ